MESAFAHVLEGGEQRTSDVAAGSTTFEELHLNRNILKGLQSHKFLTPTKIQAAAIPMAFAEMDLLVQSKSGTGKTLIYVLAALQLIDKNLAKPQVLIIVPTRELAVQVEDTANGLSFHHHNRNLYKAVSYIGGTDVKQDRVRMAKGRIVVGTPGRLLHLIHNKVFNTSGIKLLVLDEADQLYATQSLQKDVQALIESLGRKCQMIACSATYPNDLDERLAKLMHKPILVSNSERATVLLGIRQFVYELPNQVNSMQEMMAKLGALRKIFDQLHYEQGILFASSQSRADSFRNYLKRNGVECDLMSGAMKQSERLETFEAYRTFKTRTMVATDLMARGVDSSHANLVINLDPPKDLVTYLHRIGRAGRFGSKGIAITFITSPQQCQHFKRIIAEAGTGMSVLQFPEEPRVGFDFWNFESYDFPYFQKMEAHEQKDDELKRIKQRWKGKAEHSDVEQEVVQKPAEDLQQVENTVEQEENPSDKQIEDIKVAEEIEQTAFIDVELGIPQEDNKLMAVKESEAQSTVEPQMKPNSTQEQSCDQNLLQTSVVVNDNDSLKTTEKSGAPSNEPTTIKLMEELDKDFEEQIQLIKTNLQSTEDRILASVDVILANEQNEQTFLEAVKETVPVESKLDLKSTKEVPPQNAFEQELKQENLNIIKSAEQTEKPLEFAIEPIELTPSIDIPAAAPNSINTKTYCLMPPTERSSTTLLPLGISNTVDDASSIISDSMENDYDSDASYSSLYSLSDARIVWRRALSQRKLLKRRQHVKRRIFFFTLQRCHLNYWPKQQKVKKPKRKRDKRIVQIDFEGEKDVFTLTECQNEKFEPLHQLNYNRVLMIAKRFNFVRLLKKFDNKSELQSSLKSFFDRTSMPLEKYDKWMDHLYDAIYHYYYKDHSKPKAVIKPILPDISNFDKYNMLMKSLNLPQFQIVMEKKQPKPLDKLTVHVNQQVNIMPIVVAAPDLEEDRHSDSSGSYSDNDSQDNDSVEGYSSSGFAESTDSASSGIETSQYGSTTSSEMDSNDNDEEDEEEEEYDDEEEDSSGWSLALTVEETDYGTDTQDEIEEKDSNDDDTMTAADDDDAVDDANENLALAQERWLGLFQHQYQFIANYVDNYMATYRQQN